jgi:hypothetical protein
VSVQLSVDMGSTTRGCQWVSSSPRSPPPSTPHHKCVVVLVLVVVVVVGWGSGGRRRVGLQACTGSRDGKEGDQRGTCG